MSDYKISRPIQNIFLTHIKTDFFPADTSSDDTAVIIYTSGDSPPESNGVHPRGGLFALEDFAYLKAVRKVGEIRDPLIARQVDRLYNGFLTNQIDERLLKETVGLA